MIRARKSIRFVSISHWPHPRTAAVIPSPFSAAYNRTLSQLDTELWHLGATQVVMQAFFQPNQIRQDGYPYADARPSQPGVILSLQARSRGSLSFPCYRYRKFEDNVRAIALSLQALRSVDRYGVTQRAEQYQGWAQIEPPKPKPKFADDYEAAEFLSVQAYGDTFHAAAILRTPENLQAAYRSAARLLHPDTATGDHEKFVLLQDAMEMLK